MLSPGQFRKFVLPSLEKQTRRLDHSLYHLDGKDAIRHVPALMELERPDALQWTRGPGPPDGAPPDSEGAPGGEAAARAGDPGADGCGRLARWGLSSPGPGGGA